MRARRLGSRRQVWFIIVGFVFISTICLEKATKLYAADPTNKPAAFDAFRPPAAWQAKFWADKAVEDLLERELKDIAALVPDQAGVHFCRCPNCDLDERDEGLGWSIAHPERLVCKRCGAIFPDDKPPAKDKDKEKEKEKVPEELVEVLPGVIHHYPYLALEPGKQRYPDERIYLAAHRDDHAKIFAAKLAVYSAAKFRDQPPANRDRRLARIAAVILARFAKVYPSYAMRLDRPDRPKLFDRGDLPPPYRLGYETCKWDSLGGADVPLNLVIAYYFIRDDEDAWREAARIVGVANPRRSVERDLFRASAEFVRRQPEEIGEQALEAIRGMLAVGRLLNDQNLTVDARDRLTRVLERGFYYDGLWRDPSDKSRRRVMLVLDGWISRFLSDDAHPGTAIASPPILEAARNASAVDLIENARSNVLLAGWPPPTLADPNRVRRPLLLGGGGIGRLSMGDDGDGLDVELLGWGDQGASPSRRLIHRIAVGGRIVLSDIDDAPASLHGWERATASHNTVMVDGLNHRETIVEARREAPASDFLFFAADRDFQVATFEDRYAYPDSTTRYRETMILSGIGRQRYAVSIFEVRGGSQHDQVTHAAPGVAGRWKTNAAVAEGPESLLPSTIRFLPEARAEDGRWFAQALGEFQDLNHARVDRSATAWLEGASGPSIRLHFLNDFRATLYLGETPRDRAVAKTVTKFDSKDAPSFDRLLKTKLARFGASVVATARSRGVSPR